MSKQRKMGICGGVSLAIGVVLLTVAIVFPILINKAIKEDVIPSVAITKENEENWDDIPGPYGFKVLMETYVYNWTNPDEVLFDGAQPIFDEVGPIPYLNNQKFMDANYTRLQVPSEDG
jgi:hypothetical protein